MAILDYASLTTSDWIAASERLESWTEPDHIWSLRDWSALRAASPELARYLEQLTAQIGLPSIESRQGGLNSLAQVLAMFPEAPEAPIDSPSGQRQEIRRFRLAWRACAWKLAFPLRLQREKLESLRQLAYGASHEINNPLANISTRAQVLLTDETVPERRHKLAAIATQAFRAHEMIANLMLFARPPEPVIGEFDARRWLDESTSEWQVFCEPQATRLTIKAPSKSVRWLGDPGQLTQLVSALVRNSCEALGRGGSVELTCEPVKTTLESATRGNEPTWWQWTVADDGPGFTPDSLHHAFDPFYSGREAGRGLGFGLSKCWVIARGHGGEIEIESETSRTLVRVRLPIGPR
ncbi:MAG: HAMP domain-containing histidine kinase [Planctomycetales bacterium]|nr:HAMP domain-containing histidine kinase [Planctomycetales bacterium]